MECAEDIQIWNLAAYKVQYLVKADKMATVQDELEKYELNYTVQIDELNLKICNMYSESLVDQEQENTGINLDDETGKKISWKTYPAWGVLKKYLIYVTEQNPEYVKLRSIGNSAEDRPILMLKISNRGAKNKPILIISGVHGHEWVGVISVLFILNSIASKFDKLPSFLQNKDWYFVPLLNPDGYDYSHRVDRFWKRNRRTINHKVGVDLAHNFGKYWNKKEDYLDNCASNYEGPSAFSEPETSALRDFVTEHSKIKQFKAFLDIRAYGQLIQFPWNAVPEKTADYEKQFKMAHMMRQMIYNRTHTTFQFATGYDVPYPQHGVSTDWAYSLGIVYSYIIKIRDTGEHGFLLPNKFMKDTAAELLRAVKYLASVLDDGF